MSAPVAGFASLALTTAHLRSTTHARQRGLRRLRSHPPRSRSAASSKTTRQPTPSATATCPAYEAEDANDAVDGLSEGDRWSTSGINQRQRNAVRSRTLSGWSFTTSRRLTNELGILKTGKEADVFLAPTRRAGDR